MATPHGTFGGSHPRRGFTLVEVLVTLAVVAVLVALTLTGVGWTMRQSRSFKCQMSLRSVAFDFAVFADDELHGDRGEDRALPGNRFRLSTFAESQYGLDEFWRWPSESVHTMPDPEGNDPMRCSEVRGDISVHADSPCTAFGSVTPSDRLSYAFNIRLQFGARRAAPGLPVEAVELRLTADVMHQPDVPLLWDIDGAAAGKLNPMFSGPSLDGPKFLGGDQFWFPSFRHNGRMNAAFLDGHVAASGAPLEESSWRWEYSPEP